MAAPRRRIYLAGWATLLGMGGLGWVIMTYVHKLSPFAILPHSPEQALYQTGVGIVYAFLTTRLLLVLLERTSMDAARSFFGNLLRRFRMRPVDIWFISFCAGFGEELLFRGALQPWLGIWITAVVFVALHGYLDPFNRPILGYGIFMVLVCAGFGYLTDHIGLWSASVAHMGIDIVLMNYLLKKSR
jgi:membrane protease YdiL (CAAX protease family)